MKTKTLKTYRIYRCGAWCSMAQASYPDEFLGEVRAYSEASAKKRAREMYHGGISGLRLEEAN